MRNYGQHNALLCGLREAQHDVIVTLDDDLQHPPEEIPILFGKFREGYDIVYGIRQHREDPLLKKISSSAFWWILRKFSVDIPRGQTMDSEQRLIRHGKECGTTCGLFTA
jgi:undecaprenyl-phosphate 4-deoxy-4-formamido-L-arabinose transferase